jgi:hypothetical protein
MESPETSKNLDLIVRGIKRRGNWRDGSRR